MKTALRSSFLFLCIIFTSSCLFAQQSLQPIKIEVDKITYGAKEAYINIRIPVNEMPCSNTLRVVWGLSDTQYIDIPVTSKKNIAIVLPALLTEAPYQMPIRVYCADSEVYSIGEDWVTVE